MALVGNDGIVGTAIFLGGESTSSRAVVVVAGQAFRMSAMLLLEEFERNAADEKAWSEAVKAGTIASFNDYLIAFPAGAHAADAQAELGFGAVVAFPNSVMGLARPAGLATVSFGLGQR